MLELTSMANDENIDLSCSSLSEIVILARMFLDVDG